MSTPSSSEFNPDHLISLSEEEVEDYLVPVQRTPPARLATDIGLCRPDGSQSSATQVASNNASTKRSRQSLAEFTPLPASKRKPSASRFSPPSPPSPPSSFRQEDMVLEEDPITDFDDDQELALRPSKDKSALLEAMGPYGVLVEDALNAIANFNNRAEAVNSFWSDIKNLPGSLGLGEELDHPLSDMFIALVGPQSAGKSAMLQLLVSPAEARKIVSSAGHATSTSSVYGVQCARSVKVIDTQGHRAVGGSVTYTGMQQVQQTINAAPDSSKQRLMFLGLFRASTPDHTASMAKAREEAAAAKAELVFVVTRAESIGTDSVSDLTDLLRSMKEGGEKIFFLANPPKDHSQSRAVHLNDESRTKAEYKAYTFVANHPALQDLAPNVGLYALLKYVVKSQSAWVEAAHAKMVDNIKIRVAETKKALASQGMNAAPSLSQFPSEKMAHIAKGVLCLSKGKVFSWTDFCLPSRFQVKHPSLDAVKSFLMGEPAALAGQDDGREVSFDLMDELLRQVDTLPPKTLKADPIPAPILTHMVAKYTTNTILEKATGFAITAMRGDVQGLIHRAASACLDVWMSWVRLAVSKQPAFELEQAAAITTIFEAVLRTSLAKSSAPLYEAVCSSLESYQTPSHFDHVKLERVFSWIKPSAEGYGYNEEEDAQRPPTLQMLQAAYEGRPGNLASALCFCVLEDAKIFAMRSLSTNLRSKSFQAAFANAVQQLIDSPDQLAAEPAFAGFLKEAQAPALQATKELTQRLSLLQDLLSRH